MKRIAILAAAFLLAATGARASVDTVPGTSIPALSPWSGTAYAAEIDDGDSGSADIVDFSVGNFHKSTLTGDAAYTFTAPVGPAHVTLRLVQDGSGGRTPSFPANVLWEGGSAPVWDAGADSISVMFCYFDGANYLCSALTGLE